MPLPKETVTINFSQGLDTLDDPNQLAIGKFTSLVNSVFIKSSTGEVGALKKRNGFTQLPATVSTVSYLTNYNGGLMGLGNGTIQQYSNNAQNFINQGFYQPVGLNITSLIKNSFSQNTQDSAVAPNGIGLIAYLTTDTRIPYQYAVFDSSTGQIVSGPLSLSSAGFTITGSPRVYVLGSSFFVLYGTTANALNCNQVQTGFPFTFSSSQTIDTSLFTTQATYLVNSVSFTSTGAIFDATIASNSVFVSYLSALAGTGCNLVGAKISPTFTISTANLSIGSFSAACIGNSFDQSTNTIYTAIGSGMAITYAGNNFSFASTFVPVTKSVASSSANFAGDGVAGGVVGNILGVTNIAALANNGICKSFYEVATYYNQWDRIVIPAQSSRADNIIARPVTSSGVVGSETIIGPELGLASKPFTMNGSIYLFGSYQSTLQPSYFLINSTGLIISKFAYGNGGGYYYFGVPNVSNIGNQTFVSFLQKDLIVPINNSVGSNSFFNFTNPFYSQTGINIGTFTFSASSISARQTGNTLSFNGGFLWTYDGFQAFENNFLVYPETLGIITIGSGPGIFPQQYQYQIVYETMDSQGNISQSSPGIVNTPTVAGAIGSAITFLTCSSPRLTYRGSTIVSVYRWSPLQPIFYKLGSYIYTSQQTTGTITTTLTVTTQSKGSSYTPDSIMFRDTTPDSAITGNEILYTAGNVQEDSSAPSFIATDVWDERLWGISAEDNTLWFSKQLVKATPVEMVQNFALYVPPVQTALGTSQIPLCLAPMDDKQVIFCKNSILFINGTGPDNTGANGQYSEPTPIPSQVGCANQASIVQTPYGLIFQSDNGIWLLGRDLQVKFIGKEVEGFNSSVVTSANCIPGTNEVRFSLNTGQRLIYDLLADQWATFQLPQTIQSSTVYNNLDTVLTTSGQVFQETPNAYLDGTTPVVMSFTTGWINLSGLQGYARAYWMEILGTFQSPHTYTVGIAYDYNPAIVQTSTINPFNTVGSGSFVEQWEIGFKQQQCQSFQLTFTEISSGTVGAGVVVSGISLTYGKKKTYARNIAPQNKI